MSPDVLLRPASVPFGLDFRGSLFAWHRQHALFDNAEPFGSLNCAPLYDLLDFVLDVIVHHALIPR